MPVLIVKAAGWMLSAAVAGVLGNRADAILVGQMHELRDHWQRLDPGDRSKVEKAVRRACLLATISACSAYLESVGKSPAWASRGARRVLRRGDPQTRAVERLWRNAARELRHPDAADVTDTGSAGWLVDERGAQSASRVPELRDGLVSAIIGEFRRQYADLPEDLFVRMRDGWQARDGAPESWYSLMTAFFQKEMDRDVGLARLITQDLLRGLTVQFDEIRQLWLGSTAHVLENLNRIDHELQESLRTQRDQQAVTAQLPGQLVELTAQVIGLGSSIEVIAAGIGLLTSQESLQQKSMASVVDEANEELYEDLRSRPFVGRQAELSKLDDFVREKSGRLVVVAPAGSGKTALLAEWRDELIQQGFFIAAHFFSDEPETRPPVNALRHLARQLCAYYRVTEPIPSDKEDLRDLISMLLTRCETREEQPLVVIMDALDEAEGIINPLPRNPRKLKQGACVVVSARAEHAEQYQYLEGWIEGAQLLELGRLSLQDVQQWTRAEGQGRLARWARDRLFISAVMEKTQGFPLYLHHLLAELVRCADQEQDPWTTLSQTPRGFTNYVERAVTLLGRDISSDNGLAVQLLALLVAAKGPLEETDIEGLLPDASRFRLKGLPWQATRWMNIQPGARGSEYSFSHTLLAPEFEPFLSADVAEARRTLLQYCRDWRRNGSLYALQYAPDHFLEAIFGDDQDPGERPGDALIALATDDAYSSAVIASFPRQPELPLRTAACAFQAADAIDDPARMTEFLLIHARLLETIRLGSPLAAVTEGELERAWRLADLKDELSGEIWQLLIAWWLRDHDDLPGARATLGRLRDEPRPIQLVPLDSCAAWLLAQVADVDAPAFGELRHTLIGDWKWDDLIRGLAARGLLAEARQVLDDWQNAEAEYWARDSLVREYLGGWIDHEDPAQLPVVLDELIDEATTREDPESLTGTLIAIADVLIDHEVLDLAAKPLIRAENLAPGSAAEAVEALAAVQQRLKLYDEMLSTQALTSDISTQLRIRGAVARGVKDQGDPSRAEEIWRSAPRPRPGDPATERATALAIIGRETWRLSQGDTDAMLPMPALATISATTSADEQISAIIDAVLRAWSGEAGAAELREALEIAHMSAPSADRARAVTECLIQVCAFEAAARMASLARADPRLPSLTALVDGEKRRLQVRRALKLTRQGRAEEARRIALEDPDRYQGPETILGRVARLQSERGEPAQALATADLIKTPFVRAETLVAVALAARDNDSRTRALERAAFVARRKARRALLEVAQGYASAGDAEEARRLIAILLSSPRRRADDGKEEEEEDAASASDDGKEEEEEENAASALRLSDMLLAIAEQRVAESDRATAVEILERARRLVIELVGGLEAEPRWTARLAHALAHAGATSQALEIASGISDPSQAARALSDIARRQSEHNDNTGAKTTLLLARRRAREMPVKKRGRSNPFAFFRFDRFDTREKALQWIARQQADVGAYAAAVETVTEADAEARVRIASHIAAVQGAREPTARGAIAKVKDALAGSDATVIQAAQIDLCYQMMKSGRGVDAFEVARTFLPSAKKDRMLKQVVLSSIDTAEMSVVLQMADLIEDAVIRAEAYSDIKKSSRLAAGYAASAEAARREDEVRQALAVAAEAARAARTKHAEVEVPGRPSGDPDHVLTEIAIATAGLGDFPAAMHIASDLPDKLAVRPLAVIARGQAEAGDDAYRETCELALSAARSSATDAHEIARELALAGMGQEAMAAAQLALQQGSFGVKAALAGLAGAGDRSSIKQAAAVLLAYPGYAEDAVALLARGYPEMTMRIVAAIESVARHGAAPLAQ
jgi:hypothetical protein